MDEYITHCAQRAGTLAVLLTADLPNPCQQKLCGELEWDLKLDERPKKPGEEENDGDKDEQHAKKKHKSQRRIEKEQEYYERQQRMHDSQKAKTEAMKRTKCRFYQFGKCKEGDLCRFGHD